MTSNVHTMGYNWCTKQIRGNSNVTGFFVLLSFEIFFALCNQAKRKIVRFLLLVQHNSSNRCKCVCLQSINDFHLAACTFFQFDVTFYRIFCNSHQINRKHTHTRTQIQWKRNETRCKKKKWRTNFKKNRTQWGNQNKWTKMKLTKKKVNNLICLGYFAVC